MKEYNFEHPEEFEKLFKGNNREITDEMVSGIIEAFQFQKESAPLFSISFGDVELAYEIILPKDQWPNALQKCLDLYHDWGLVDEAIDTYLILKEIKKWVTEES